LKFFKTDRCRICKKRKGHRFCLRKEGNICWNDCNELRVDLKCPDNCKYALNKSTDDNRINTFFEYKTNADSQTEFTDLLRKEMDKWMRSPQEFLDNEAPVVVAESETGRKKIAQFFEGFNIPDHIPMNYLKQMLKLDDLKIKPQIKSPDETAMHYLNTIISFEWEKTLDFVYDNDRYSDEQMKNNYITRISSNKILRKIKHFDLISSAISEDRKTALIYFELQGKYELTIVLRSVDSKWFFSAMIFGRPELVNGENEAIQQVAVLLSKNRNSEVYPLLQKYTAIYSCSADLYYYWGLYYTFLRNSSKAKENFYTAMEIDPEFLEAKYNYALVLHSEKQTDAAKILYCEIIETDSGEIRSMNNLASILIEEGNHKEARVLLNKCLEVNKEFEVARKNLERIDKLIK